MVNDISASFTDSDTRSGIAYRFYLPVSLNTVWQATTSKGFLYDDFDLLSWQSLTGTWSVSAGLLLQSDNAETNTNLYTPLTQNASTLYLFRTRTRLLNTTGNRRWGFHIFADDPTQTQRGNSYLIWLRADNNTLQIYETIANTLYTRLTAPLPFPLTTNTWYDIIVVYNNGTLTVYLNDTPIGSWTDTSPFPGSHLSLRTNQAQIEWDYFTVWQSRSATALIEVGPTSMAFTQNPNPTTPAFRLYSLVQDQVERFSAETYQETSVDWTPPSAPPQVRDSLGVVDQQYCYQPDRLWANWDASADPHSDIQTYEYAIGTAPGSTDVVSWTPINALSFTHTGLSLISGTTYYTTVRAKNHAGLYSNPSTSNGITFLGTPLSYTEPHALSSLTQIYPNPTFDEIVIQWTDTQKATCILYDLQGRALRQIIVRQGENRLSLGDVARGLYLLWVERDKTYLIQKL
ncbi:MAG: T9SS type A sorting domain-containing protein [Bacteroidia bacterium]